MKQATFTELRNNAKQFFDAVEAGEPLRFLRENRLPPKICVAV